MELPLRFLTFLVRNMLKLEKYKVNNCFIKKVDLNKSLDRGKNRGKMTKNDYKTKGSQINVEKKWQFVKAF